MKAMGLNKEKGPIYSRYDRDQPENYSPIVDYAAPPRTSDEIQFMLARKITPNQADPNDMRPSTSQTHREGTTPTPNRVDQTSSWSGQRQGARRTPSQNRAALIGVIIWFLFIVASLLMNLFRK
jgi:hypothetical protein